MSNRDIFGEERLLGSEAEAPLQNRQAGSERESTTHKEITSKSTRARNTGKMQHYVQFLRIDLPHCAA